MLEIIFLVADGVKITVMSMSKELAKMLKWRLDLCILCFWG